MNFLIKRKYRQYVNTECENLIKHSLGENLRTEKNKIVQMKDTDVPSISFFHKKFFTTNCYTSKPFCS